MANIEEFKKYIVDNKTNLNKDVLKNADINQMYSEYQKTWSIWQNYFNPAPINPALEDKIKSGKFSWKDAYDYNKQVWSKTGARDLALTSKEWVQNLNTTVTPDEAVMINNAWIKQVWEWVTADLQWWTAEDYKQNVEKITTKTPEWETIVTKETPKGATDFSKIQSVDEWKTQTGWWMDNLETWVESKYGSIATQENGKLVSTIWNDKYEWTIDEAWNPRKTKVWVVWEEEAKILAQKQLEEAKNPENIYKTLQSWITITDSNILNSDEYKKTKQRFDKFTQYKDFNYKQFQTAFNEWLILPWTQLFNDLAQDPKVKLQMDKAIALNKVNWEKISSEKVFETQSKEIWNNINVQINWETMPLTKALEDWYIDDNEYKAMTNTWEVVSKLEEVEDLKNEMDRLQSIYDNTRADVERQLEWTGATLSDVESIVWEKQNNQLWNLNLAISKYNNSLGTLAELKKLKSEQFATNLGLYNKQEQRTYEENLAQKQLEQKFAYEYWDINSTDENVQRVAIERAIADMYNKYPIIWMESQATKVQKVKDRIAQGMTWAEAISSVEQEIRNSPAYKDLMASQKASMTPKTTQDWSKLSDTELYNQKTWEIKSINPKQAWVIDLQVWDTWWQCGTYARQYTWITTWLDAVVWTTAKDRVKSFTDTEPKEWWLVLFTWWNYDKQYWHIAVVTSVNWDWTINITESNLNNDWKVTTRTVWVDEVTWFYNDTPLAWWGKKDYTDNDIALLSSVAKLDKQWREVLKENWYTEQEWANFNAWLLPPTTSQKTEANKVIWLVNKLASHPWLNNAVWYKWPIWSFTTIAGTDKADFEALFNTLVDSLAASNLDKIKWAMSDKDIEFLRNIEKNGLNYDSSQKQFKEQLNEIAQRYNAILTRWQTAQPTQTIQTNQWDYSEEDLLNSLK